jgi:hypothetical protein
MDQSDRDKIIDKINEIIDLCNHQDLKTTLGRNTVRIKLQHLRDLIRATKYKDSSIVGVMVKRRIFVIIIGAILFTISDMSNTHMIEKLLKIIVTIVEAYSNYERCERTCTLCTCTLRCTDIAQE